MSGHAWSGRGQEVHIPENFMVAREDLGNAVFQPTGPSERARLLKLPGQLAEPILASRDSTNFFLLP